MKLTWKDSGKTLRLPAAVMTVSESDEVMTMQLPPSSEFNFAVYFDLSV
jgi:hypothetical protein